MTWRFKMEVIVYANEKMLALAGKIGENLSLSMSEDEFKAFAEEISEIGDTDGLQEVKI